MAISLILLGYACDHPQTHIPPTFPFTPTRGISRVWSTTSKHRYSRWCTVKHRPTTTVGHSGGRHSMAAAWESPLTYYLHAPLLSRPRHCTRCPRSAGCARTPATRASVVCHGLFVFVHTYDDTCKIIEHLAACKRAMLMNILLRTPVFLRYNENECSKRDLLLFPSVHLPSASRSYGVRRTRFSSSPSSQRRWRWQRSARRALRMSTDASPSLVPSSETGRARWIGS